MINENDPFLILQCGDDFQCKFDIALTNNTAVGRLSTQVVADTQEADTLLCKYKHSTTSITVCFYHISVSAFVSSLCKLSMSFLVCYISAVTPPVVTGSSRIEVVLGQEFTTRYNVIYNGTEDTMLNYTVLPPGARLESVGSDSYDLIWTPTTLDAVQIQYVHFHRTYMAYNYCI